MERAIKIVEGFIADLNKSLDEDKEKYKRTRADSIYEADYRRTLEKMFNINMYKLIVLEDVKRALESASMDAKMDEGMKA